MRALAMKRCLLWIYAHNQTVASFLASKPFFGKILGDILNP